MKLLLDNHSTHAIAGSMKTVIMSLTSAILLGGVTLAQEGDKPKINWEQIKKRIEGAVERGDITRDQANAKYEEIKKRGAGQPERLDRNRNPAAREARVLPREARMKQLLGRLVESKKITPDIAHQIAQIAFEARPQGPPAQIEQQKHLEHLSGQLEHLIERAHHELGQIEKTRLEMAERFERERRMFEERRENQRRLMQERREQEMLRANQRPARRAPETDRGERREPPVAETRDREERREPRGREGQPDAPKNERRETEEKRER